MTAILIVLGVLVVVGAVVALAMGPTLQKKGDAAVAKAKELLGADNVLEIEPKAVGLATEPPDAGTNGGLGCLAVSASDLVFVTWGNLEALQIPRSSITKVDCSAEAPAEVAKAAIIVEFTHAGGTATTQFRLSRDLVNWLTVLGYDWGPDGPPAPPAD